jgi:glycosyltransferase involved in cell wall biosynthesis
MEKGAMADLPVDVVRTTELNVAGLINFAHGIFARIARCFGRRLRFNYFADWLCIPDTQVAWLSLRKGMHLARQSQAIYATCSPFSSAITGCLISRWTRKPLIVDFRDPWSMNAHNHHTKLHLRIVALLERLVIDRCDRLVLNTTATLAMYQRRYPEQADKMVAIPNGYDELPLPPAGLRSDVFSIMHFGSFYGTRTPNDLLDVLAELNNSLIEFVQIGPECKAMNEYVGRVRMRSVASVGHEQATEMMRSASILYLKQGYPREAGEVVTVAAKTYEYLASGLPILADVPPGSDATLIQAHSRNAWLVTSGKREDLKTAVLEAFAARHSACGLVDPVFIEQYARKNLTQRLAVELDRLSEVLPQEKLSPTGDGYKYA